MAELSFREKEMRRLCGAVPEKDISLMKQDMKGYIRACRGFFAQLERMLPPAFDPARYRDGWNHMELAGGARSVTDKGFYGAELVMDDLHGPGIAKDAPLTEIVPPMLLNELAVRTAEKPVRGSAQGSVRGRKRGMWYDVWKYDGDREVMFWSRYERKPPHEELVTWPSVLLADPSRGRKVFHPEETELVISAAIPVRWSIPIFITGMWGQWGDASFFDFPVLLTWHEDEPYRLYRDFAKDLEKDAECHAVLAEAMESGIGFQRYLVGLAENAERTVVRADKRPGKKPSAPGKKSGSRDGGTGGSRGAKRSVIDIGGECLIYAKDDDAVRQFRKARKCGYRFTVRGHMRHYKNGRTVWIKPYDKNKDKPFRSHKYTEGNPV